MGQHYTSVFSHKPGPCESGCCVDGVILFFHNILEPDYLRCSSVIPGRRGHSQRQQPGGHRAFCDWTEIDEWDDVSGQSGSEPPENPRGGAPRRGRLTLFVVVVFLRKNSMQ